MASVLLDDQCAHANTANTNPSAIETRAELSPHTRRRTTTELPTTTTRPPSNRVVSAPSPIVHSHGGLPMLGSRSTYAPVYPSLLPEFPVRNPPIELPTHTARSTVPSPMPEGSSGPQNIARPTAPVLGVRRLQNTADVRIHPEADTSRANATALRPLRSPVLHNARPNNNTLWPPNANAHTLRQAVHQPSIDSFIIDGPSPVSRHMNSVSPAASGSSLFSGFSDHSEDSSSELSPGGVPLREVRSISDIDRAY